MGRIAILLWAASLFAGLAAQRIYAPPKPALQQPPAVTTPPLPASSTQSGAQPDALLAGHDLEVGTFYYNRGNYVGALARFEDAIYNDPSMAEAYCRAGDSENKMKHSTRAQADWNRCLKVAGEGKWADHARKALSKQRERG
ncbi:MAG TPA: hypothetical protein VN515_00050 [Terriglobales bacterium]|nr:hypothetical protein [Terriglobales bacterium]